jgi:hypothetical protein
MVAHACYPSCSGGTDHEDHDHEDHLGQLDALMVPFHRCGS